MASRDVKEREAGPNASSDQPGQGGCIAVRCGHMRKPCRSHRVGRALADSKNLALPIGQKGQSLHTVGAGHDQGIVGSVGHGLARGHDPGHGRKARLMTAGGKFPRRALGIVL
jgi:hypothetical protein